MTYISINLYLYVVVGVIFGIFATLFIMAQDYKQYECFIPQLVVASIAEGFIFGLAWIISVPILIISKVIIFVMNLILKEE
jgi:hypothetical protein